MNVSEKRTFNEIPHRILHGNDLWRFNGKPLAEVFKKVNEAYQDTHWVASADYFSWLFSEESTKSKNYPNFKGMSIYLFPVNDRGSFCSMAYFQHIGLLTKDPRSHPVTNHKMCPKVGEIWDGYCLVLLEREEAPAFLKGNKFPGDLVLESDQVLIKDGYAALKAMVKTPEAGSEKAEEIRKLLWEKSPGSDYIIGIILDSLLGLDSDQAWKWREAIFDVLYAREGHGQWQPVYDSINFTSERSKGFYAKRRTYPKVEWNRTVLRGLFGFYD